MKGRVLAGLLVLAASIGGCGSNDEDTDALIREMNFNDSVISRGDGSVLKVDVQFSRDRIFNEDDELVIVLELPESLEYRRGSAEVQAPFEDEDVGANEVLCPSGVSYLEIELDEDDLFSAEDPDGKADARVTLTLDGVRTDALAVVRGKAAYNGAYFSCADGLIGSDASASIRVTG